ncbi:hypothetical protein CHCC20333_1357 [Bacillus paralicheniformis]|nr:hypothetical protein CHCC20333_1357 [Bacillus paralicheniformis]
MPISISKEKNSKNRGGLHGISASFVTAPQHYDRPFFLIKAQFMDAVRKKCII